jgi:hypothetical protein
MGLGDEVAALVLEFAIAGAIETLDPQARATLPGAAGVAQLTRSGRVGVGEQLGFEVVEQVVGRREIGLLLANETQP